MQLDSRLTASLVCPVCKGALVWDEEKSQFTCPRCALGFKMQNGIPNMIPEEAQKLTPEECEAYAKRLSLVREG